MTLEEAIKGLKCLAKNFSGYKPNEEMFDMAISALQKQIPQKANIIQHDHGEDLLLLYCPACKNWIGTWNSRLNRGDMRNISNGNICPHCGQAIDWEEDEE